MLERDVFAVAVHGRDEDMVLDLELKTLFQNLCGIGCCGGCRLWKWRLMGGFFAQCFTYLRRKVKNAKGAKKQGETFF